MTVFWKYYDRGEVALTLLAVSAMIIAVLIAAVGRSIGLPVASAPQTAQLFLIWTCMLGADLTLRAGNHIRVTALPDALGPRARAVLNLLLLLLMVPFLAFLAWYGVKLVTSNWSRPLATSGFSYGWVTLALPVGAVLMLISVARRLVSRGISAFFESDDSLGEFEL